MLNFGTITSPAPSLRNNSRGLGSGVRGGASGFTRLVTDGTGRRHLAPGAFDVFDKRLTNRQGGKLEPDRRIFADYTSRAHREPGLACGRVQLPPPPLIPHINTKRGFFLAILERNFASASVGKKGPWARIRW